MKFLPGDLQAFPILYLGIPLSINKPRKCGLQHLVDKVVARLPTWKAGLLTKAGRTVLVKTKMSAIPVYMAIAISISPRVLKCIDNRRRAFLWKGTRAGTSSLLGLRFVALQTWAGFGYPTYKSKAMHSVCVGIGPNAPIQISPGLLSLIAQRA